MRTHIDIRNQMMGISKDALEDVAADQLIHFRDAADNVLCSVQFKELASLSVDAKYEFIGLDDTNVLRAVVDDAGTVTNFTITGKVNAVDLGIAHSGTVGTLSSQADIKFNKTIWTIGNTITLNQIRMYIREGS